MSNWVNGYPRFDVDEAYEAETARMWEEQQPDQANQLETIPFEKKSDSSSALFVALMNFDRLEHWIDEAIAAIPDTPEAHKLASIMDAANDLRLETREISDRIHRHMFPESVSA